MSIRKRPNGSWIVDFASDGVRVRKTVAGTLALADVMQIEQRLMGQAETITARNHPERKKKHYAKPLQLEWKVILDHCKANSLKKGLFFTISTLDLHEMIKRSNGKCELTGIPFSWERTPGLVRRPYAASVDRIVPSLGYIPSNCRLVLMAVNFAMNEWGEHTFRHIANALVANERPLRVPERRHRKSLKLLEINGNVR